jgi:dipeptidyl aminopeptidase/acylaminoacyl peptidase
MNCAPRIAVYSALLIAGLLYGASIAAADQRPMTPVDVINIPELSDPQLSPDAARLLYVRSDADWEQNGWVTHIWRHDVESGQTLQLTNGASGERSPRWAPNGRQVAFLATRAAADEEEPLQQIYLISDSGGEAEQLGHHETAVSDISWSADGEFLYFLAADPKPEEQRDRESKQDDMIAYQRDYQQQHLWRVSVRDGREQRVTAGDFSVLQYSIPRDGRYIVHSRSKSPLLYHANRSELWVMAVDGAGARRLTDNSAVEQGAELSPDGRHVLFLSGSNASFEPYFNSKLFLVSVDGGGHKVLLPDVPYDISNAHWSADGTSIVFVAADGLRRQVFVVDVSSGELRQLTEGDHTVSAWHYSDVTGAHIVGLNTAQNGGDLWLISPARGAPQRLTRVYDYLSDEFQLPEQSAVQWRGRDGVTVEGLLHYPLDFTAGRRYPLVVQTHGGPASADTFGVSRWMDYTQVLTAMGYLVLQPNYRGSTGYGDAFLRNMVGHYFDQSHLDVLTGVDVLIERGLADGERLLKMGWSAGGHMTNKLITFSDRFKAASSGAGAVNWISMYGQTDINFHRTAWFGGTPWQRNAPIEVYWQHSPLADIAAVSTPTLIFAGMEDQRVPAAQSIELFRALESNGVPTQLYLAPREPHVFKELRHALFKINAELDWFERHAMERSYEWQAAPVEKEPDAQAL